MFGWRTSWCSIISIFSAESEAAKPWEHVQLKELYECPKYYYINDQIISGWKNDCQKAVTCSAGKECCGQLLVKTSQVVTKFRLSSKVIR